MPNPEIIGKWIVILGISLAIFGGMIWLLGRVPGIQNFPGTIKINGAGITCIIPLLASILISVVLTVVLNILIRISRR